MRSGFFCHSSLISTVVLAAPAGLYGFTILCSTVSDDAPVVFLYRLHQNYPNPFNPSTTIAFELPTTGHVHLALFDIAGWEIAEPVNSRREAGTHTVGGEIVLVRKMAVLK